MERTIHTLVLKRENASQKWGFGITGGNDVLLTFRVERVSLASPAGESGLKNLDYIIRVNDTKVFDEKCMLSHNELVKLIKNSPGDSMELEIERGEVKDKVTNVVPSFDLLIPKAKDGAPPEDKAAYYLDAMKNGYANMESPGMFTAVGKPRLKTGKHNVPISLYSAQTLIELSSSGGHGFVDEDKLAPDACPAAKNRKRFDPSKSNALVVLTLHEKGGTLFPEMEDPTTRTE
jgi:hypothetical protein